MDEEQEHKERPRPRVVDKRVSARTESEATAAPVDEKLAAEGGDSPPGEFRSEAVAERGLSEHREGVSPPGVAETPAGSVGGQQQVWTPEQEAEMRAMAQQIAETPSRDWVLNTAVTLANVAGTKLDLGAVADAQLAIDALGALVDTLGPRLGEAEAPLRQTLAQLRMAYAQMVAPPPPQ